MWYFRSVVSLIPPLLWVLNSWVFPGIYASSSPSWSSSSHSYLEDHHYFNDEDYEYLYQEYPNCDDVQGHTPFIGDGDCDIVNTNEECGYDGGDCCACTCEDSERYSCGWYHCVDPDVSEECREESNSHSSSWSWGSTSNPCSSDCDYSYLFLEFPDCYDVDGYPPFIGDGLCDVFNSNEECGYDGGDCCICTCEDTEYFTCGYLRGYYCFDPDVSQQCREESNSYSSSSLTRIPGFSFSSDHDFSYPYLEYQDCIDVNGHPSFISDGDCDASNNNEECDYDGGDCCVCTCEDTNLYTCGKFGEFNCLDPYVSDECREASN